CYHTTLLSGSVVVCTKHPCHRRQWMVMDEDQPPTAQMRIVTGVRRHIEAFGSELRGLLKSAVETAPGAMGPEQQAKLLVVVSKPLLLSVLWEPQGSILKTLWMLRSVALSPADNWKSTCRLGDKSFNVPLSKALNTNCSG
uniref:Uncharacterized protein n=1 Tax=Salmo trutta TaxID=8032 RepID=A0A673ZA31_SALTR